MPAVVEYDPDDDPLMGRLVSVRASSVAPSKTKTKKKKKKKKMGSGDGDGVESGDDDDDRWLSGVILYCETVELADGTEVGSDEYRLMYGNFKSTRHALNTKRQTQKVRARARGGTILFSPLILASIARRPRSCACAWRSGTLCNIKKIKNKK